jgi:hypothetical protein
MISLTSNLTTGHKYLAAEVIEAVNHIYDTLSQYQRLFNEDNIAVKILEDAIEVNGKKKQKSQSFNQVNMTKSFQSSSTIRACKATAEVHNKKVGNKRNHKVVIIGDSHSSGLGKGVQYHLNKNFEVIGLVKPGAGAETIVNSAMGDIVNLLKK